MSPNIQAAIEDLKAAARQPELTTSSISKATAMVALDAIRVLQSIANAPIGRNSAAEAAQMRAAARLFTSEKCDG